MAQTTPQMTIVATLTAARGWRDHGVVLVGVLWVIALLSIVAVSMSISMRNEIRLAGNLVAAAQARHAAEGGVQLALLTLLTTSEERGWQTRDAVREFAIGGAEVRVKMTNESGKIDLNAAPERLLDSLLMVVGVQPESRRQIVDAIADWRDADNLIRPAGAEDEQYAIAGKTYGAKDGPFESVDELQLVRGITPPLYRALKPALTVHSRLARVNPETASRLVLLALLDGNDAEVDQYMAQRAFNHRARQPAPPLPATGQPYVASGGGFTFSIHAHARIGNEATALANAIVDLRNRDKDHPLKIRDWRREGDALFAQAAANQGGVQ
jgi:general secretion pathway protein K